MDETVDLAGLEVLVACPLKQRAWVIPEWYDAIVTQQAYEGIPFRELYVAALCSASDDDTEQLLLERGVKLIYDDRPGRKDSEINGHFWGDMATFEYMADLRNKLVEYALAADFDYFFSLDSDIILPPGALARILSFAQDHPGLVAPAVRMQFAQPPDQPVAWNVMKWVDKERPTNATGRDSNPDGSADVIMAAVLMDRRGMEARWRAHQQGEDIGLCLDAHSKGIQRWWMSDIYCEHLMFR